MKSPRYWDGVSSWRLAYGERRSVARPAVFFSETMPEEETLVLVRPPGLYPALDDSRARARLLGEVRDRSEAMARRLREDGGRFMGMERVRRQPRRDAPDTRAPRRGIRPTVAGKSKWARIEALQRQVAFIDRHRRAREDYESGAREVEFPPGTYWMAVRFGVTVAKN